MNWQWKRHMRVIVFVQIDAFAIHECDCTGTGYYGESCEEGSKYR